MTSFDSATAVVPRGDRLFDWSVPDGWQQGRGAWGGLVVGALVRAVTGCEPDPTRRLRSLSIQMAAPALVGGLRIVVAQERRGSAMSTWSARLQDTDGRLVAGLSAILGSPRVVGAGLDEAHWGTAAAPTAPPSHSVPVLPLGPPVGPVFAQHVEVRPLSGAPAAGGRAVTSGWIRYTARTSMTAASVAALVDAWWPASLTALTHLRPLATVSFTANLLIDPATLDVGQALLYEGLVSAAGEGYSSEQRRLWTADGRLVVDNLQSIVVIA